jgi:hypothetical protein
MTVAEATARGYDLSFSMAANDLYSSLLFLTIRNDLYYEKLPSFAYS